VARKAAAEASAKSTSIVEAEEIITSYSQYVSAKGAGRYATIVGPEWTAYKAKHADMIAEAKGKTTVATKPAKPTNQIKPVNQAKQAKQARMTSRSDKQKKKQEEEEEEEDEKSLLVRIKLRYIATHTLTKTKRSLLHPHPCPFARSPPSHRHAGLDGDGHAIQVANVLRVGQNHRLQP